MNCEVRIANRELKRRTLLFCCLLPVACCLLLAGCGNVSLSGEGLTAAENSAMDAYQAVQRSGSAATTQPTWEQSYLVENYKQWRFFVRSARKDLTWGPKLAGE